MVTERRPALWLPVEIGVAAALFVIGLVWADTALLPWAFATKDILFLPVLLLDHVTLKIFSDAILPVLLVAAGLLFRRYAWGRAVLFIGAVQGVTVAICDGAKPIFGRLRPFDRMAEGGADTWFSGGYSFMSGHTGFYAGLAFPIVYLFPRSWPLLALPLMVAVQRIISTNHHLSDVSASLVVAGLVTYGVSRSRLADARS